jgi:Acyl-CoA dehydrogenases
MDFELSEEQRAIATTVRDFVARELVPHEDLVERLDAVPEELAREIRARPSRPACTPRTSRPSSAAGAWTPWG